MSSFERGKLNLKFGVSFFFLTKQFVKKILRKVQFPAFQKALFCTKVDRS